MNPTEPVGHLDRYDHDLAHLAAGEETGWWDQAGAPAP